MRILKSIWIFYKKLIVPSLIVSILFGLVGMSISGSFSLRRIGLAYIFLPNHVKIKKIISIFCDKNNARLIKNNDHIRPFLDKRSKQFSGGEKRLVEIFLIVYSNAKYILIDELKYWGYTPENSLNTASLQQ